MPERRSRPPEDGAAPRAEAPEREIARLREQLEAAEGNFRSAFLATPAGMSLSRVDTGKILDMNDAFLEILRFPRAEVVGRTSGELGLWTSEEQRASLVGELRAKGKVQAREERMRRKDGTIATVLFSAVPAVVGGEPHTITWVLDISARREAEESLRASEARWRSLVEQAPILFIVTDTTGVVRYVNRSVTGRPLEPMIGKPVFDFLAPPFREDGRRTFARTVAERAAAPFTHYLERVDGGRVWLDSFLAPVLRDGALVSVMIISTDITRRVEAEDERRAIEAKMQQAQKLESLGVLAGGIAHDFNNLLTAVLGNAELALAELPPAAAARESVEQIQKAGLHAAELTRQMLAYAGRGSIAMQRVSLREVVRDMAQLLGASISKRHALILDLDASLPAVAADPAQVRQIAMNLVINASEAIGAREGVVTVSAAALGPGEDVSGDLAIGDISPGSHVLLEVTDTGGGMDTAILPRIFDPFYTTKFAGRGLGLAAVLGIVRRHGGTLRVRSRPGAGSTFSVLLPVAEAGGTDPAPGPGAGPARAWRGAGTILLVDDEEPVRCMAARMLGALGFEVVVAADGVEALARLEEQGQRVRGVLLDMTMPRMDGEATLREIRRIAPGLPVVLCSGYDVCERRERFADPAFSGFLQKPFRLADLERALRHALGE